ncbi:MAG: DUF3788 domain-containing protein [Ruminococcaceae bacterium]|nr:DUF3788 domain-containing protein [Oscillospiraceae bacterium]
MLENVPTKENMQSLLGEELYPIWEAICERIDTLYDVDHLWDKGYRDFVYEYKYRRGGKTLCTFYVKSAFIGLQIVLGKEERAKFEARRGEFSPAVQAYYDGAHTYHDGKWILFSLTDEAMFDDLIKLLAIKRRPNRK